MAKPQLEDSFNVHVLAVPLDRLGPLTALLAREGFGDVRNELVTTVRSFARNNQPADGVSSADFLRAWIADHPTFRARDAVNHFRAEGRGNGHSAYAALIALVEDGTLKKPGPGQYARADVKQIAGPKKKAAKAKATKAHFEVPNSEALLTIARRNHGRFTSELAKKYFAVQGRAATGVGPTISHLIRDKLVRRTANGSYELTAKGAGGKLKAPRKTGMKKRANGAMPPAIDQLNQETAMES